MEVQYLPSTDRCLTYSSFDEYDAKRLAHIGSDVPVIWSKM
jgi:hypothetical protein